MNDSAQKAMATALLLQQLWILILVVISRSTTAQEVVTVALDPLDLNLQANANCCPVSGNTCNEEECPATADLLNSADGSAITEWVVEFISDVSENGPRAEISFDFGQIYDIDSVTLLSRTQFLPRNWSLIFSSNGTISDQIFELRNEGTYEQIFSPMEEGEDELQASYLQVLVNLPSQASPAPVSIAEIVITVTGADLMEEQGCGVCVEDLQDDLSELVVVVYNSSNSLPSVNQTQEELIQQEIVETQISVKEYEDFILVLAVVLGLHPPLEDDADISPGVPRLDLALVPPIPTKLDQLRALLDSLEELDVNTNDLEALLNTLEPNLGLLLSDFTELMTITATRRDNFTQLIAALSDELNVTEEALEEATVILELILSRNFSMESNQLQEYQAVTNSALTLANSLWDAITVISEQVMSVDSSLDGIDSLLQEALDIALNASTMSRSALTNVQAVDDIIEQIEDLISEAASLDSVLSEAIINVTLILDSTRELLQIANESLQLSSSLLPSLDELISLLRVDVEQFLTLLTPYRLPESCDPETPCTENEVHASMLSMNASIIVGSPETVYTLRRAREFLENIAGSGQLFNYSVIIEIARQAQRISQDTLNELSTVNTTALLLAASSSLSATEMLDQRSQMLAAAANDTVRRATDVDDRHTLLRSELEVLQESVESTRNQTSSLTERTGLEREAFEIFQMAEEAYDRSRETDRVLTGIEDVLEGVRGSIMETRMNAALAEEALDVTEDKFASISVFLNATRTTATQIMLNISNFIAENDRIISDIDDIISGLADIHSRVNKINSPVQLLDSEDQRSYLSLQPPPSRVIDNTIQFESLDLYFWTGSEFRVPSLLFYAGPVYREGTDDINTPRSDMVDEDYFLVTVEQGNMLQLQWNMRGTEGSLIAPGFSLGFSEVMITRQGSEFQVRYGVSTGSLGDPRVMGNVNNGSLLFSTSNRTAFLLGGWPQRAQLGLPGSPIPLMQYNTFQGQLQLFLFNGEQWGLWNIRGASATEFIGSFQRSALASANIWKAPRSQPASSSVISFDGAGYLFVEQLADLNTFTGNLRTIEVVTRPNEERAGLVMYAYDPELFLSMEVAYSNGDLHLLIRRHDTNTVLADYTQEPDETIIGESASEGRGLIITFANRFGYQINDDEIFSDNRGQQIFFTNLTRVKVWYGGVDESLLESPYIPEMNTAGYCGCIDILVEEQFVVNIFSGNHFLNFYLESPVLKGFAATCLTSIYAREVSFDGTPGSYLTYAYLELVEPTNDPPGSVDGSSASGAILLSFSFVTLQSDGVILASLTEESYLVVLLRGMRVEVHLGARSDAAGLVLESSELVMPGVEEHVLIELGAGGYSLYLNGILQSSLPAVPGLPFDLITNPADSTAEPVLYIGGIPEDLGIQAIPQGNSTFVGCLKDLAFNFTAMSFLNTALPSQQRYPTGVSYHTCPFINISVDPLLAVNPEDPVGRACLGEDLAEVQNTHGGFHRQTTLTTSNIIDLISSSWTLSMSVRLVSDGHVMTLRSAEGHVIRLSLRLGQVVLSLSEPVISVGSGNGSALLMPDTGGEETEVVGPTLDEGVFTPIAINCEVNGDSSVLSCSLSVGGVALGQTLEAPHTSSTFFPQLPLVFGNVVGERESFIGCIADLATNGDTQGFSEVQTDTECFNRTQAGYGFAGISHLSVRLSELEVGDSQSTFMIFQPRLDNGLVLTLTDENATTALLAIGIYNGELRLSDFNGTSVTLLNSVCNPENPTFYNLSLTITEESVAVAAQVANEGERLQQLPFQRGRNGLLLTFGNIPPQFEIAEDSDMFAFLLSTNMPQDQLPPGLIGCVNNLAVNGDQLSQIDAVDMEHLQIGFCPIV